SQLDANNKTGLGYGNHVNGCEANDSKSVSDEEDSSVNDRFKKSNGNHVVSPPYTGNYKPPRAGLSFAGLDDSVYKCKVTESIFNVSKVETNVIKSCTHSIEKPKTDSDNDSTISPISGQPKHTPMNINFVKLVECVDCVASVSAARRVNTAAPRPNVNSARPNTTQDLVIIKLIHRVKRLERELKARTPPTKIQKRLYAKEQAQFKREQKIARERAAEQEATCRFS
nr:hypothetical protein [Tanacetum cinerariifolium]